MKEYQLDLLGLLGFEVILKFAGRISKRYARLL
jgi:hypothetical protein